MPEINQKQKLKLKLITTTQRLNIERQTTRKALFYAVLAMFNGSIIQVKYLTIIG
jgi:hypothetical protein